MGNVHIMQTLVILIAFGDACMKTLGAIVTHCKASPSIAQLTFYVVDNETPPLLGRDESFWISTGISSWYPI